MKRAMVDLETVGNTSGCGILSIGAVAFDEVKGELGPEFYVVINRQSCVEAGLHEDQDTLNWWGQQSEEAQTVLNQAGSDSAILLSEGLDLFNKYLSQFGAKNVELWGNGSDFDNPILICAYRNTGVPTGWKFWNNRCYRTLKNLVRGPKLERVGTYHNALDDAKSQALHAIQLLRLLRRA